MKTTEINKLSSTEISEKIVFEKASYHRNLLNHLTSPIENPIQLRNQRRLIARLMTALTAKQNSNQI